MAFPKITDLVLYINKKLTGNDWNTNWQKIVNWLSLGDTDIKVKSVETESIKNNGNDIIHNGNIDADSITANTVTADSFIGDGSQLTNINVADVFAYTPFSVNSAMSNFIDISDTSKLHFLVDDGTLYKPLIITTAEGKTITITSINDYDVSGLTGTYYIFADEETNGGTVYLKTCDIYRQSETPTGNNGDVWFDTSCQKYVVREKVSSNWYTDEYDKVPLAQVVVSGGTISSLTMMSFNYNGYTMNFNGQMKEDIVGACMPDYTTGVTKSNNTDYVAGNPLFAYFISSSGSTSNWGVKITVGGTDIFTPNGTTITNADGTKVSMITYIPKGATYRFSSCSSATVYKFVGRV